MLNRQLASACANCGKKIPPLDGFCVYCGQPARLAGGLLRLTGMLLSLAAAAGGMLVVGRYADVLRDTAAEQAAPALLRLLAGRWGVFAGITLAVLLVNLGLEGWNLLAVRPRIDRRYPVIAALLAALLVGLYELCWTLLWGAVVFPLAVQWFCAGYALGMVAAQLPVLRLRGWRLEHIPFTGIAVAAGYLLGLLLTGWLPDGFTAGAALELVLYGLLGAGAAALLYLPDRLAGVGSVERRLRWWKGHRVWVVGVLFGVLVYLTFG